MSLLLRIGRRRTSFEASDVNQILDVEFRTPAGARDLRPSVYEVAPAEVVRTYAEHCAAAGMDPPRGSTNVDLTGVVQPEPSPGNATFAFTRAAHRELPFKDELQLRAFVRDRLLPEIESRRYPVDRQQLAGYVASRLADGDLEWVEHVRAHPKWALRR